MILTLILFLGVLFAIILLIKQLRKKDVNLSLLPPCNFYLSKPVYEIKDNIKIARYTVKNRLRGIFYFEDFPISFMFFSKQNFRSKITISYSVRDDDEVETIYDQVVDFSQNNSKHIDYINNVIVQALDFEIEVESQYGNPSILFEIIQSNFCHKDKEYTLLIQFPEEI